MVILNDEDADDAFAGDDPPVAIPGCSTKASQLQVNNTTINDMSKEEENNNCFNFSFTVITGLSLILSRAVVNLT